jgi:hypothetical protein
MIGANLIELPASLFARFGGHAVHRKQIVGLFG